MLQEYEVLQEARRLCLHTYGNASLSPLPPVGYMFATKAIFVCLVFIASVAVAAGVLACCRYFECRKSVAPHALATEDAHLSCI